MGKRIIQQARGHGSLTYRVRPKAYRIRITYPRTEGKGIVLKLINSPAHFAPIAKIRVGKEVFHNVAVEGIIEGQEIEIGKTSAIQSGNIAPLSSMPIGTDVCNIESVPFDGGKFVRTSGSSAKIVKKTDNGATLLMPSKQEKLFSDSSRATMGRTAAAGRLEKPILKAGKMWHMMKAKNRLWPRTSAVKMNAVDHPFGCGRGKRIKSKIAKRNAPPGAMVGLFHPRRTGRKR